jgi:hypothetical protein
MAKSDKIFIKSNAFEIIDWVMISLAFISVFISYAVFIINAGDMMNSDIAMEIILGREMWLQKSLFPEGFYYTTELFLIRTSLFVALWSFIIGDFLNLFKLTIITEILLELFSLIYLLRSFPLNKKATVLGVLVFFGARSYLSSYFMGMGGSAYATMYITSALTLGYYLNRIQGVNGKLEKFLMVLIPILALGFGFSSVRMLVILFFPILFVHIIEKFWSKEAISFKKDTIMRELFLWNIISFIGYQITVNYIAPKGFGPHIIPSSVCNSIIYIITESIPGALTEIFHTNPIFPIMIPFKNFSLDFLNGFLGLIYFIVIIICVKYSLKKCTASQSYLYKILLFGLFTSSLLTFIFMSRTSFQIRYLMLAYVLIALILSHSYEKIRNVNIKLARVFIYFLTIFCMTNGIYNSMQIDEVKNDNVSLLVSRNAEKIEEAFQRHGIKRGYALYWDSSAVTVLSNNRIELAPVWGDMTPRNMSSLYRYYSPDQTNEKTAFIKVNRRLNAESAESMDFAILRPEILDLAIGKEVIYDDGTIKVEIYYYDKNYFRYPQGYNPKMNVINQAL